MLHCNHETDYISRKQFEIDDRVEVSDDFFEENVGARRGKVIEFSLGDLAEHEVAALLDNPPSYANARLVHKVFVNHAAS